MIDHSVETWAAHEAAFRSLPGAENIVAWYGDVPGFHDADLVYIHLLVGSSSSMGVKFWRLKPTLRNERVLEPVDQRIVVFTCDEVVDLELANFGPATELNALRVYRSVEREGRPRFSLAQPATEDIDIVVEPHYGLSGWLRCRNLRVELGPANE